jgi:hypothetical protein
VSRKERRELERYRAELGEPPSPASPAAGADSDEPAVVVAAPAGREAAERATEAEEEPGELVALDPGPEASPAASAELERGGEQGGETPEAARSSLRQAESAGVAAGVDQPARPEEVVAVEREPALADRRAVPVEPPPAAPVEPPPAVPATAAGSAPSVAGATVGESGPPKALVAAARAYFGGDYRRVLALLESVDLADPRAALQARLLRAAAAFTLYRLGGGEAAGLLASAEADRRACRRLDPGFSPDPGAFSPRFRAFYASGP